MSDAVVYLIVGLVGGMLLSFFASVAANVFHRQIDLYLHRSRHLWNLRSLASERERYNLARRLFAEPSVAIAHFSRLICHVALGVACMTISSTVAIIVVVLRFGSPMRLVTIFASSLFRVGDVTG